MFAKKLTVVAVAGALALLSVPVLAQTTPADTKDDSAVTTQAVPTSKLVSEYTDLAGSKQNATSLVTGLRTGSKITLEPIAKDDKAITFTSPTKNLGNGEVKMVLAMADRLLADDKNVTNKDLYNALMDPKTGILTLRADGMGWGQIANSYGFKVGEVMGKAPSKTTSSEQRSDRVAQRAERAQRPDRPDKVERFDKPDRPMKPDLPQRPERGR